MTAFERFLYHHLHRIRRFVQVFTLLGLVLIPILNKQDIHVSTGTLYSLSMGNLDMVDPALLLQTILLTGQIYFPLLLAAVVPLVIAFLLGKVFCSWVCPFNLLGEFAEKLRRKINPRSVKIRNSNPRSLTYWLVFGAIILAVAVSGIPIVTLISLPGLLSAEISDWIGWGEVGIEGGIIVFIILIEIIVAPRFWCKYVCPVGATLALFRSSRTLKIYYNPQTCSCRPGYLPCNSACPIHLDPRQANIYPYCYNCGECVEVCREKGQALQFTMKPVQALMREHKNSQRTFD
ncbi:MAG: hypothetical protein Kow0042_24950 [Calditrichia bacterium]